MSDVFTVDRLYGTLAPAEHRSRSFQNGEIPVAVYGLGKLGLPVAATLAEASGNVIGADVDPAVVRELEQGRSHVDGEPGLDELVERLVEDGSLSAVQDPSKAAARASIHVIVVPTLLDDENEPDLAALIAAASSIAAGLDPGDLVLLESTVPPGTTAEMLEPSLAAASGLDPSEFGVAFCPERISSGRALKDIREAYPKIVGGTDEAATEAAALIYEHVTDNEVIETTDATTAEAVKVFGGVYRDVNIALANEFARYADEIGVDVEEVTEAANTVPVTSILEPGIGVGGHCIPVYPHFLTKPHTVDGPVIPAARALNDDMPAYAVDRLADELAAEDVDLGDATVVLFGLAYRGDVAETRYSPSVDVAELLAQFGAEVLAVDPVLDDATVADVPTELVSVAEAATARPDAAIYATDHGAFERIDWSTFEPMVVLDGRNALDLAGTEHRQCRLGDGKTPPPASHWLANDPRRTQP
ncbi:nucleotide sugar dehydrogenase [Salinarchaeum sp. Harcht-Bsk1]|uniref:nucleotide sugar dehydrogenase n=1 Tax=Salinarchaeum sp. Harcht-Bsk1 TaxID=1333523 RepID=UPI00034232AD|nr:nucleotide sugar dehydrogenase [Salinarchaeum sp. Harcht-Bsk1]AGN02211.1 nucleotide sugar dehydrogenase [Salinarchaeum sp. Harcht-Bsk1]